MISQGHITPKNYAQTYSLERIRKEKHVYLEETCFITKAIHAPTFTCDHILKSTKMKFTTNFCDIMGGGATLTYISDCGEPTDLSNQRAICDNFIFLQKRVIR